MTTNTTQLTIDLATLVGRWGEPDDLAKARRRASLTFPCVIGFLAGCAGGAVLEVHVGLWALTLPVLLAALAVPLGEGWGDGRNVAHEGSRRETGRQANAPTATSG